jgi:hypothetical protein
MSQIFFLKCDGKQVGLRLGHIKTIKPKEKI